MPSKTNHFWISIIGIGSSIACALALFIASLGAAAGVVVSDESTQTSTASSEEQTYEGLITDTRCGAKHQPAIARSAADCARVCVHGGAQFALIDGDKAYVLDGNLQLLKRIAGQRARIVGSLNGNTITVSSMASGE